MARTEERPVAVVTGANRGIGYEVARQLASKGCRVVLAARDETKARAAAERLRGDRLEVEPRVLDVNDARSIARFCDGVERDFGRVDILINNAGIFPGPEGEDAFMAPIDGVRAAMETNVYGPLQLCQRIVPMMQRQGHGRVVNLSSGMGQLTEMNGGYPAYRLSKTAINAITRIFADETAGTDIQVNSVCPGWVRTDMGGPGADLSVEEGADTIVWLALQGKGGPSGGFFREREKLAW